MKDKDKLLAEVKDLRNKVTELEKEKKSVSKQRKS